MFIDLARRGLLIAYDCIHCRKATTKPQSVKGAFLRMLTTNQGSTL